MSTLILLDYLKQLEKQGVHHVEIDEHARSVLRELYTRGSARRPAEPHIVETNEQSQLSSIVAQGIVQVGLPDALPCIRSLGMSK